MKVLAGIAKLEPYIVPDSFSFSFESDGESAMIEYEERGILDPTMDSEGIKRQFADLHRRIGLSNDDVTMEIKDGQFLIREKRTERKEIALARIFNETLFQMKCYYSDSEIHRIVDGIVVSEILDDESAPLSGSFPGIGFYTDHFSIDPSFMTFNRFVGFPEIIQSYTSMVYRAWDVLFNSGIKKCLSRISSPFEQVFISLFLGMRHYYHRIRIRLNKNLLGTVEGNRLKRKNDDNEEGVQ